MKNIFLVLISLTTFFISCKKDEDPQTSNTPTGSNTNCTDDIPWNESISYGSVTDIEGNEYRTVVIGSQNWMAEPLKSTKYNNGDPIPSYPVASDWLNATNGAYSPPLEIEDNDTTDYTGCYGNAYNWYITTDSRNVCPTGWHIPTHDDFKTLETYLENEGHTETNGLVLMATDQPDFYYPPQDQYYPINSTDLYGFRLANNAGGRAYNGTYYYKNGNEFWLSTPSDIGHDEDYVTINSPVGEWTQYYLYTPGFSDKTAGRSIRCIKDNGFSGSPSEEDTLSTIVFAPTFGKSDEYPLVKGYNSTILFDAHQMITALDSTYDLYNTVDSISIISKEAIPNEINEDINWRVGYNNSIMFDYLGTYEHERNLPYYSTTVTVKLYLSTGEELKRKIILHFTDPNSEIFN